MTNISAVRAAAAAAFSTVVPAATSKKPSQLLPALEPDQTKSINKTQFNCYLCVCWGITQLFPFFCMYY